MTQGKANAESTTMADRYIGHYKIVREITQDGSRQVFEAVDLLIKKRVIIKGLKPEISNQQEIKPRLFGEIEALGRLNHPHIARLFGFVRRDDELYLVMEFVEGESLRTLLKRKRRLEPNVAWAIFHEILAAVGFAHRLGVIHGDLRPSNIMVTKLGVVKVVGFSMAPMRSQEQASVRARSLRYTAPEQLSGAPADARSDIYALGVMLYEMLIGHVPLEGASEPGDQAIFRGNTETKPLSPGMLIPECPAWLDGFFLRALATSPSDRFQSVSAMSQAIMAPVGAIAEPGLPARIQARLRRQTARWRTPGWDSMARAAKRRAGSLQAALAGWVPIGQEKASLAARSLSHAIAATRHTDWARRFGHLRRRPIGWAWRPASANRLLHRCKKILAIAAETGWKRYAVLALLSGAVMIETFFFAGANTLLRPDKPTPGHSYNADVDQLFARIDSAPTADKTQNLTVGKAPKVEKAREARPKLADSTSRAERAKAQSKPGERAAIDKPRRSSFARAGPEKPSQQPAVQEPRPRAPNVSPGGAEKSNAAKIQLNVQWED
jgi:tRNA A-37 threonylcarbamoyl transferase component Bud32